MQGRGARIAASVIATLCFTARASADETAPEELPDGADLGGERSAAMQAHGEATRGASDGYLETSEAHDAPSPASGQVFVGIAVPLPSSGELSLSSHAYADAPVLGTGDVAFLGNVLPWLALGGRAGVHARWWVHATNEPAMAHGLDALFIASAGAEVDSIVWLGGQLGAGLGWSGVRTIGPGSSRVVPRLHASLIGGFRIERGVRLLARTAYDWFSLDDVDRAGSDFDVGGFSVSFGLELRP